MVAPCGMQQTIRGLSFGKAQDRAERIFSNIPCRLGGSAHYYALF
jgi:hypothetical protein